MIKFSIIVPTYNRLEKLKIALLSILNQTYQNFEIIVVNDGGEKVTENIVKSDKIKYINNIENKGLSYARNTGIKYATGDFICFLDDDDAFLNNHLNVISQNLNNYYLVYYTDAYRLTYKYYENQYWLISKYIPYSIDYDRQKLLLANISPFNCFAFHKKIFEDFGNFNEEFKVLEDWEFLLRISEKYNFYHIAIPTVNVNFEIGANSLTNTKQELFNKFRNLIYRKYEKEISLIKNKNEIIKYFNNIWAKDYNPDYPLVSIIVLTHNNKEYTEQFFLSLEKSTQVIFELIIIDNASTDGTVEMLQNIEKSNPEIVKVIYNNTNKGFPKAINQGLKIARGSYVVIANNDIITTPLWLERMVRIAEKDDKIGLVGVLSNEVSGIQKVEDANYFTLDEMKKFAIEISNKFDGQYLEFPRITFLCTLIKDKVIEKLGGLDERFSPGNFEDDDYCIRTLLAGYKCTVAKDVFIHHFGSRSFTKDGKEKYLKLLEKNRKKFIDKWGADFNQIIFEKKDIKIREHYIPLKHNEIIENFERIKILIKEKDYQEAIRICKETIEEKQFTNELPIKKEDFVELLEILEKSN